MKPGACALRRPKTTLAGSSAHGSDKAGSNTLSAVSRPGHRADSCFAAGAGAAEEEDDDEDAAVDVDAETLV